MTTKRTVWPESPSGKVIPEVSERQVSVPWCSVHRCSASVHEGQCWFHWGASNHYMNDGSDHGDEGTRPLLPCVIEDGVVWKTVDDDH